MLPKNGICRMLHKSPAVIVSNEQLSRDMTKINYGNPGKTYAFPPTVKTVSICGFYEIKRLLSVRLNEGLEVLKCNCFERSGIKRLMLPASVCSIEECAFSGCNNLQHVDFRAARSLKFL